MNRTAAALLMLAVIGLSGCAPTAPAAQADRPSQDCLVAMKALADEVDEPNVDPLLAASLDTCTSVDEWLAALRVYPAAMALTDESLATEQLAGTVCVMHPEAATCGDAAARGLIE